jgi:hypothetical protein
MNREIPYLFQYKIHALVMLIDLKLPARVVGILRNSQGDQYQVVWWWDGQRRCEWLFPYEIEAAKTT